MSYIYAGMSYDTASQAARAAIEQYLTADGFNDDEEVLDYLLSATNEEILAEMQDDGWSTPEGVTWSQMADALGEVRKSHNG